MKFKNNVLLIIDKPKGYTSRDVVNIIGKIFETKKVGHNGTLDPLATGVLVVCLNRYTKLNKLISAEEKEYVAEVTLGIKTDTLDIVGKVLEKRDDTISKEDLEKTFKKFTKTYNQEVPIYSAVKVKGKKLYEYARNGEEVTIPKKEVTVKKIELLDFKGKTFTFKCLVSKGTYIRSLIKDILDDLNVIGTMSNLIRTKQGVFDIKDAYNLEEIKNGHYKLLKIKDILDIPKVIVSDADKTKILNGNKLKGDYPAHVLFLDKEGHELAIYQKDNGDMKVSVMLWVNEI